MLKTISLSQVVAHGVSSPPLYWCHQSQMAHFVFAQTSEK